MEDKVINKHHKSKTTNNDKESFLDELKRNFKKGIKSFFLFLEDKFDGLFSVTAFFVIVYLAAWSLNAIMGYKFDLKAILELFFVIVGKDVATHGIDSALNSKRGVMPEKPTHIYSDLSDTITTSSFKEEDDKSSLTSSKS